MANIEIHFDPRDVMMRSQAACDRARFDTANQVLADSNFYCKRDTGTLIDSALINSLPEQGVVQWVIPYAAKQYEYPYANQQINPNASAKWFEVAQQNHGRQWFDVYRNSYNQNFGGGSP